MAKKKGVIKSILWHQGETDANSEERVKLYEKNIEILFSNFRNTVSNNGLSILVGELSSFAGLEERQKR